MTSPTTSHLTVREVADAVLRKIGTPADFSWRCSAGARVFECSVLSYE
jgi:hypothetical protein